LQRPHKIRECAVTINGESVRQMGEGCVHVMRKNPGGFRCVAPRRCADRAQA
jgi:hypothetical protein